MHQLWPDVDAELRLSVAFLFSHTCSTMPSDNDSSQEKTTARRHLVIGVSAMAIIVVATAACVKKYHKCILNKWPKTSVS